MATIKYDANGGEDAPESQYKIEEKDLKLTSDKPTKTVTLTYDANGGMFNSTSSNQRTKSITLTFRGWATSKSRADAGTIDYASGATYSTDANITLYAVWAPSAIGTLPTVGTGTTQIASRDGYRLDTSTPWTTTKNGSTAVTSFTTISSNTTIYAKWQYRIRLYVNGGVFQDDDAQMSKTVDTGWKSYGVGYDIYRSVSRLGYTCKGWGTSASATSKTYNNVSGTSYTNNSPIDLYVVWQADTYTVTFKTGSGYGSNEVLKTITGVKYGTSISDSQVPIYGVSKTVSGKLWYRPGPYSFVAWSGSYVSIMEDTVIEGIYDFVPVWIMNSNHIWVKYEPKED